MLTVFPLSRSWEININFSSLLILYSCSTICHAWLPDTSSKLYNKIDQISSISFSASTFPTHFIILDVDKDSILLGGRNKVYNLSIYDLRDREKLSISWPSSEAHRQLCILKGKSEDDCQNYIRVSYRTYGKLFVCGTNSYKPYCRTYSVESDGTYKMEREMEGIGVCPHDPEHNSTAIFTSGHLFSATVADFSGGDPLIYRKPQRTELSDLKQLNAPNFVSSMAYGDYVFIFYRETAVEFMNCGKVIYSRVGRVCKSDKGGPHPSRDRWTSFLKTRLNCSAPGEYPFYFDEIQSASSLIEGVYQNKSMEVVYGVLTTPNNAIGGSAICVYSMKDILSSFDGSFKGQENINSNWLPVSQNQVPEPRPGQCIADSRLLPTKNVNFIKAHSLMEDAVPALFGKPILIRVSLKYRFTSIVIDPQVQTVDNYYYDILYLGTDDGQILKAVNIPNGNSAKAVVISENKAFKNGAPIKQVKLGSGYGRVIAVTRDEVKLINLNHCSEMLDCHDCVKLQDPHCAWDPKQEACISLDVAIVKHHLVQDVATGNKNKCWPIDDTKSKPEGSSSISEDTKPSSDPLDEIIRSSKDSHVKDSTKDCDGDPEQCPSKRLAISTASTLHFIVIGVTILGLVIGFMGGYLFSKKYHNNGSQYPDVPFVEQRNHLERLSRSQNGFLTPRLNKSVNLDVVSNSSTSKKDNISVGKDLNIVSDGTLQKIKKTYI